MPTSERSKFLAKEAWRLIAPVAAALTVIWFAFGDNLAKAITEQDIFRTAVQAEVKISIGPVKSLIKENKEYATKEREKIKQGQETDLSKIDRKFERIEDKIDGLNRGLRQILIEIQRNN